MTEQEWMACTDPQPMLEFLGGNASDRKLRLFAIACVLPMLHRISHEPGLEAVEVSERYADGLATEAELYLAYKRVDRRISESDWVTADDAARAVQGACMPPSFCNGSYDLAGYTASWTVEQGRSWEFDSTQWHQYTAEQRLAQANLLRDVFGNLFRPIAIDPAWLTPTVLALASASYDNRILPSGLLDTARLAVLGDALEDAGASGPILEHLRSKGPHVRGCFAVDLLLGKE